MVENTGRRVDYAYDALFRLVQERIAPADGSPAVSIDYTYDAVGNRLTRTDASGSTLYAYDANNRVLSSGQVNFTYDANGNVLSKGAGPFVASYAYDALNRLRAATTPTGGTARYHVYDALNNRVARTDTSGTTRFMVDPFGHDGTRLAAGTTPCCGADGVGLPQVLRETDESGAPTDYIYAGDRAINQSQNGAVSYYLSDGQQSTRALASAGGATTDTYDFDAFGNLTGRTGSTANTLLYAGQQFDPNADLYYLRARHYDPHVGRLTSIDPYAGNPFDPPSLHPYVYAYNDPMNKQDPSGAMTLAEFGTAVAVAGVLGSVRRGRAVNHERRCRRRRRRGGLEGLRRRCGARVRSPWCCCRGHWRIHGRRDRCWRIGRDRGTISATAGATVIVRALPELVEIILRNQRPFLQGTVDGFAKSYRAAYAEIGSEMAKTRLRAHLDDVSELSQCAVLLFMKRGMWRGIEVVDASGGSFSKALIEVLNDLLRNSSCRSWE